ncbi:MAG: glycosyltransferase family 9 protein [Verrucomicrobiae bacterium]|nr:glycosyltransferase family 9 protein [Verrucomicrobiae bacterium]
MSDLAGAREALVIKPSSFGDVIHTLPAVAALHRSFPELRLRWVVNTEWAPLLRGNPALVETLECPRREWRGWRDWGKARRWARETLAPLAPDVAIDFQGLLRSALMARASNARVRVGFARAREGAPLFYHRRVVVPGWDRTHAVDRYLALAAAAGAAISGPAEFPLPEGDPVPGLPGPDDRPWILLHPTSRGAGKSLSWGEIRDFCEATDKVPVVIVGAAGDGSDSGQPPPGNVTDLRGRTSLLQLVWLMRRAGWIVSVDSGPMHLAAALTDRLLSLHTWTDPLMVGPCRKSAWVWREGFLGRVGEIQPGQFPERRRDARRRAGEQGILRPGDARRLAAFAVSRLSP